MSWRVASPLLGVALLLTGAAMAEQRVGLRVGDHPNFGRIVLYPPDRAPYRLEELPDQLVLRFETPAEFDLSRLRWPPRNARGVEAADGSLVIALTPGTRVRHFRLDQYIVVDLVDARANRAAARQPTRAAEAARRGNAPAGQPASGASAAPTSSPAADSAAAAATASGSPVTQAPLPSPGPATAAEMPVPPSAVPLARAPSAASSTPNTLVSPPAPAGPQPARVSLVGDAIAIPAPGHVGAALFRRGDLWLLVLDTPLPLDMATLRAEPRFAGIETRTGPEATVLRLPTTALAEPRLRREGEAWLLDSPEVLPPQRSILPEAQHGQSVRLLLRAARPANAVAVLDPETGGTLLVGTVLDGGEGTPRGLQAPSLDVLPTRLGAAILPRVDTLRLSALPNGFVISPAPGATLALAGEVAEATSGASLLSRSFDMPAQPLAILRTRKRNAMLDVSAAPPLGRGLPRLAVAEALLALGFGQEAQAMATLAMAEDPRLAEDPRAQSVHGAASLLAGRIGEAGGLLAPGLAETDELALWRGLLAALRGEGGASAIAAGLPLLLAYPEPLQAKLLPLAAEALITGGELVAARRLLTGRDGEDPGLRLASARLLEAEGQPEAAMAAYEALTAGRDRHARAVALRRLAELRLANGRLDAAGAARALEPMLAAWRGDAIESEARLRLAELRLAAGNPRGAFDVLQETEQLFPDLAATIRPRLTTALLSALTSDPPLAAVTLFEAHAALLPPGAETEQVLASLAERLAAFELLDRALAVLRHPLMATGGETRARLGARLAATALGMNDAAGARAILQETAAPDVPVPLQRERRLLEARALARSGAVAEALERFRGLGPEAAPELAELLAARRDWAGAAAVMREHLITVLPPASAPLGPEHQRLVARFAALLALAGDEQGLATLRAAESGRMADGTLNEAFTVITGQRLGGIADLQRVRQELDLARILPARLESLRGGAPVAR